MDYEEIVSSLNKLQKLLDDGYQYSFWNSVPKNTIKYLEIIKEANEKLKEENIHIKKSSTNLSNLISENEILRSKISSLRDALENCEEDKRAIAKILLNNNNK